MPCITLWCSIMTVSQVLNSEYPANPLLAAGNSALACYAHNYTYCDGAEIVVLTRKQTLVCWYTNDLAQKLRLFHTLVH